MSDSVMIDIGKHADIKGSMLTLRQNKMCRILPSIFGTSCFDGQQTGTHSEACKRT
jgi:hypothetical protein